MTIEQFAYNEAWRNLFAQFSGEEMSPIRIVAEHKSQYIAVSPYGEMPAQVSGRMRQMIENNEQPIPAVGDFCAAWIPETRDRAAIEGILPRKTMFLRKDSFNGGMQALAANIDTALLCSSLNKEFNIARMERYLVMGRQSGANLAVVLTKADLSDDPYTPAEVCRAVAGDIPVHVISAVTGEGLDSIRDYFCAGQTVAALGSSGVGKSTLVNALFGQEIMKTAEIREDDARGRHTTVHRQIVPLPSGGLYIDTPGLREFGLYDAADGMQDVFAEVEALARDCKFGDCRHESEPGCAVRAALESGTLDPARYKRYIKLKKESGYHDNNQAYMMQRWQLHKQISRASRRNKKKP